MDCSVLDIARNFFAVFGFVIFIIAMIVIFWVNVFDDTNYIDRDFFEQDKNDKG
jgi:hypothetical protein